MSFFIKLKKFDDFFAVFDMFDDVFEIDFDDYEIFENCKILNIICFFESFFLILITLRNGMGWVGFWARKPNPLKVWVGRIRLELGLS